jgi:hypothetical protein
MEKIMIAGKEVDIKSLEVEGVHTDDYPDFSDAFFSYGEYVDGTPISDSHLEQLTVEQGVLINSMIHNNFYGGIGINK